VDDADPALPFVEVGVAGQAEQRPFMPAGYPLSAGSSPVA
jgi:hypothetical protein